MIDEEKKGYEEAKLYLTHTGVDDFNLEKHQSENRIWAIETILNLIEKQQQKIEELSNSYDKLAKECDEEKAKDILINFRKYNQYYKEEKALSITISFELKEALNEAIKVLLTVLEKQSKEIEELKEDNKKKSIVIIEYQDLYEKLEDKIKAKIEDKESQINDIKDNLDYG